MADSTLGAGAEKSLFGFCYLVNKIARKLGTTAADVLVAASTTPQDLCTRVYAALRVAGTTNEVMGSEWRVLARAFEQYMLTATRLGLFGANLAAQTTYIGLLLTMRGTSATTDLRFSVSSKITHPNYDPTLEQDPSITPSWAYPTTA